MKLFFVAEFRKNDVGATKKVITFQRAMTKSRQFFSRKDRSTPSVAAPGDTNPIDATVLIT